MHPELPATSDARVPFCDGSGRRGVRKLGLKLWTAPSTSRPALISPLSLTSRDPNKCAGGEVTAGVPNWGASIQRATCSARWRERFHAVCEAGRLVRARPVAHIGSEVDVGAKVHETGGLVHAVEESRLVQRGPTLRRGWCGKQLGEWARGWARDSSERYGRSISVSVTSAGCGILRARHARLN